MAKKVAVPAQIRSGQRPAKIGEFINDTKLELKKVSWPERHVVTNASLVIILIVIFTTVFIGGVDVALSRLFVWLRSGGALL